jgi:hypothetical protein
MELKRFKDFMINEAVLQKDLDRMHSILKKSGGDKEKMRNYVEAMAKAIKDKHKAFQRGKAADEVLKDQELANIFYHRAQELGLDFDINVERSKTGMSKFGIETPKLGSQQSAPYDDSKKSSRRGEMAILPIGSVNIQTGESKYFNVYETWPDSTAEVWKDDDSGTLKLVFTSGDKPLHNIGWRAGFMHDQNHNFMFSGEMIEWVNVKNLKELMRRFNKKSMRGYTYK